MATSKYPILQSGFLALSEVGVTKQIPEHSTFADTILLREVNREYDNLFYSEDVSRLFIEWQANFHSIRKFDFKTRILEQAMQRFGPSICEWMAFQSGKPGFTNTHSQFLMRMCAWMNTDSAANLDSTDCIRWMGLIGPDQGNNVEFNISNVPGLGGIVDSATSVTNWVAKDGGYESLLSHMYVIFGQRVNRTQKLVVKT